MAKVHLYPADTLYLFSCLVFYELLSKDTHISVAYQTVFTQKLSIDTFLPVSGQ